MLPTQHILDRIYAGFLGKAIGVRLGAPVEPTIWTQERIADTYGEITQYLHDFRNFAADDDTNGPVYFIRVLRDFGLDFTAEQMGKTWLNYAPEEHGMYWWGGFGRSTEHTAYLNLKAGIPAPRSGSIGQNGAAIAEQIGGQIFIDSWGWVNPGNPARAAEMSARAAGVAHDGNGLHGARWVAAAIARAFDARSVDEIVAAAMATIPEDSEYARVARAVIESHTRNPADWRTCLEMLVADFGYDRYPGVCHIIPNAGVLIMAVLYGEGDLPRTVEIATMAGWDTDCNAGNAGAIIGTFQGVQPGWDKYRKPINDFLIVSGVIGSINILDIPSFARELTVLALRLEGAAVPPELAADMERRGLRFDFDLPGSTHGFRTEGHNRILLRHTDERHTESSRGALEIQLDRLERGQGGRIFYKPFYRQSDFDDERYRPMFSPLVSDGQLVRFKLWLDPWAGDGNLRFRPYVRRTMSGKIERIDEGWTIPSKNAWQDVSFTVPAGSEAIDEVGIEVEYFGRLKFLGRLFLADFTVDGPGTTIIDPAIETQEWGAISRFTWNRGYWIKEGDCVTGHTASDADMWTGHYYARDVAVTAEIARHSGASQLVTARVQGTNRFYAAGFEGDEVVILKCDFGTTVLARAPFVVETGTNHVLTFTASGSALALAVDGKPLLVAEDGQFAFGMAGLRLGSAGRMSIGRFEIVESA
jgi:ADP-ribosylglycohydrolase